MSDCITFFYRVVHWTVNDERVNLALYLYGDGVAFTWRQLTDWTRAAAFAQWDEPSMREAVERMRDEVAGWSILAQHSRWRHEMSILQIDQARPGVVGGKTIDEIADGLAKDFLVCP